MTRYPAVSSIDKRPRRLRDFLPYAPLLFFIFWESGIVHSYFQLITPLYIVGTVSGLSLLIYFAESRFEKARSLGIPLFFMLLLISNPVPYILLLLLVLNYFYRNEYLAKTIFILSPLALAEGLGLALDLGVIMLITLVFFLIAASYDLTTAIRARTKPMITGILYASFILLVISISPVDPLGQQKDGRIAYDGIHHKLDSAFFENDSLTHSTLRYLDAIGYSATILNRTITPESLEGISILIIETPEEKYSSQEIESITDFVNNGGGLFVLGDHTNIYDCYLNLNPILHNFGLHLNFDYSMLWEPHFTSLANYDSTEETAGATLAVNRSDNLIFYALKYTTWADLGDWSAMDRAYLGDIIPDKKDKFGVLPICAAANYGQGRVIAIANTDSVSGPNLPYNYGFIGKVTNYLDHKNSFLRDNWFRALLIVLILFGILRVRMAAIKPFIISVVLVLLLIQVEAVMPLNSDPANKIALDLGHANIEGYGEPHQYKSVFFTIFAQHYGFNPIFVKELPDDLLSYRAYVTMGPTSLFSPEEKDKLRDYVQNGGTLIVFDGYHSDTSRSQTNDAANSLLQSFGLHLNERLLGKMSYMNNTTWGYRLPYRIEATIEITPSSDPLMKNINGSINMYSAVEVIGGTPIAFYNATPVMALKNVGGGRIIVIGDHTIFRNFVEYEPTFSYPDPNLLQFIKNLFSSLGGRIQNGI